MAPKEGKAKGVKGKKVAKGKKKKDAKGKKPIKNKKIKKGKKDKKGKKKGFKKKPFISKSAPGILVSKEEKPPEIVKIFKYVFFESQTFLDHLEKLDLEIPIYVLFAHKCVPRDELDVPCPGETRSQKALKVVEEFMRCMQTDKDSRDINYLIVQMKKRSLHGSIFQRHPRIRLRILPTLLRWGHYQRLEGKECLNQSLLCLFFENELKLACPQIQMDTDECLCPFLPPPPPPPPPTPLTKKRPKKKKKGKKGKKKDKKTSKKGNKGAKGGKKNKKSKKNKKGGKKDGKGAKKEKKK